MFPNLAIVRQGFKSYLFDILEPQDSSLKHSAVRPVGLANFAEHYWRLFVRIQLIHKRKGTDEVNRYFRLDVGNGAVRIIVLAVTTKTTNLTRYSMQKRRYPLPNSISIPKATS